MNLVKAPAANRSLPCARGPFTRPAFGLASTKQRSCTCHSAPRHRDISLTDKALAGAAATLLSFSAFACQPALADLNKFEAAAGGEFNVGTAAQYGEAELRGKDFSGQDLRRSNFTSADARNANFKGSKLQGAYFIKAVTANANFEDADVSDVLFDRAVLNGANLKNANLSRTIFTRTDFGGAIITGADFTNALVDKSQQIVGQQKQHDISWHVTPASGNVSVCGWQECRDRCGHTQQFGLWQQAQVQCCFAKQFRGATGH